MRSFLASLFLLSSLIVALLALGACGGDGGAGTGGSGAAAGDTPVSGESDVGQPPLGDVQGCVPKCDGKQCGSDGCGGQCPPGCAVGRSCDETTFACVLCAPGQADANCAGRTCGADGCGGFCGPGCTAGEQCNAQGSCEQTTCTPRCVGKSCGPDGCGGECPPGCAVGESCDETSFVCEACAPGEAETRCAGKQCGSDGCGGLCPPGCGVGEVCNATGFCEPEPLCTPACAGKQCGPDGCDGFCQPGCAAGESCTAYGRCEPGACTPDCSQLDCGPDPLCGVSCGTCDPGFHCQDGACLPTTATPSSIGAACTQDSDCGEGGLCLLEAQGFPGGYCSQDECDTDPCPEGASCWGFQSGGRYCLLNCTDSGDCRAEGYVCDSDLTCWPGGGDTGDAPIGGACAADADCADQGATCYPPEYQGTPTGFVGGYCVLFGCSESSPCPAGSECFQIQDDNTVCLDTCAGAEDCREGYACAEGNACMPACTEDSCPEGYVCGDEGICTVEPCTPGSCPEGQDCVNGLCVVDLGDGPGVGPGPSCANLPSPDCDGSASYCAELIQFDPHNNPGEAGYDPTLGYIDYPENGESWTNQYRSWLRRDAVLRLKWVFAKVACKAAEWSYGNGMPVGLIDMSEQTGAIPGTSDRYCNDGTYIYNECETDADCTSGRVCEGSPGHPEGTHTNGFDIDTAYYQTGADNQARPVCEHTSGGTDQYHCVGPPTLLDPWRTGLAIGYLLGRSDVRVIGVDGQVGPVLESAFHYLCANNWLTGRPCGSGWSGLAYETTNEGAGWYYHHHHHFHTSFLAASKVASVASRCLVAGCAHGPMTERTPDPYPEISARRGLPRIPAGSHPIAR